MQRLIKRNGGGRLLKTVLALAFFKKNAVFLLLLESNQFTNCMEKNSYSLWFFAKLKGSITRVGKVRICSFSYLVV
jgi:hypothetical protein